MAIGKKKPPLDTKVLIAAILALIVMFNYGLGGTLLTDQTIMIVLLVLVVLLVLDLTKK